jgi:hypothetical protein
MYCVAFYTVDNATTLSEYKTIQQLEMQVKKQLPPAILICLSVFLVKY